jgi:hypothetical protein
MQGTLLKNINVRLLPNKDSADMGDLYLNDRVYGPVVNGWIHFDRVYKANGVIDDGTKGYAAVVDPLNQAVKFMDLQDIPEPVPTPEPEPTVKPLTVTIEGENYKTVVVTVEPK